MPKAFCSADHGPRKLRIAHVLRPGVRQAARRRAADRGISRRGDRGRDPPRAAQAACGSSAASRRRCRTTGSSTSRTSRTPITRACCTVLHHVPHHPPVPARRHRGRARTAATTRASRSSTDEPQETATTPTRASAPRTRTSRWPIRACSTALDEFGDGFQLQILSVFPGFVLQQIQNALAVRQIVPKGRRRPTLNWTYIGFADDTPEMRTRRLQAEQPGRSRRLRVDGGRRVGGFVQRGIAGRRRRAAGGRDGRRGRGSQRRHARDRGLGARLLEGLSRHMGI